MTDRPIAYSGEIPLSTDFLFACRASMIGIGNLAQMAFGTATVFDGLAVAATGPASMSVIVGPGRIMTNTVVDQTTYGSLPSDTSPLVKLGVNLGNTTLGPFTAPVTAGQSVNIVVQAAFSEADTSPVLLPYRNAANPNAPFSGPGNTGVSQNTRRLQTVNLGVVVGTPATTGSQTTPALTAGFVGVAVITIANGQTSIISGNIVAYPNAPAVNAKLGATNQGFTTLVSLTSGTSWNPPNGITRVKARCYGGGAAGGGSGPSGGGGGGGYSEGYVSVTPNTPVACSIGAGGTGGSGNGGNGGATTFGGLTAGGGSGGVTGSGGAGGAGGTATGGQYNNAGSAGQTGNASAGLGGSGGASGSGGQGGTGGFSTGTVSTAPGAGSPGIAGVGSSQNGTAGLIILEY